MSNWSFKLNLISSELNFLYVYHTVAVHLQSAFTSFHLQAEEELSSIKEKHEQVCAIRFLNETPYRNFVEFLLLV